MKKIKLIISMAVFTAMVFAGGFQASCLDYCEVINYSISNGEAIITGFNGSPDIICLPSKIEGNPVTEIRENAFCKCDTLEKIIIPESVKTIGHHAFYECTSLRYAEINGSVSKISEGVFYGCESLENVKFRTSPSVIGNYAFYGCRSLTGLTFTSGVNDVGKYCFGECTNLNKITLGSNLKSIKEYAFFNCENLENINLTDSLMTIGQQAIGFSENGKSDSITITGVSGSIAEKYAEINGIRFKSRIRYNDPDEIDFSVLSQIFTWLSFAVVYVLIMKALLTGTKKKRDTPA